MVGKSQKGGGIRFITYPQVDEARTGFPISVRVDSDKSGNDITHTGYEMLLEAKLLKLMAFTFFILPLLRDFDALTIISMVQVYKPCARKAKKGY